MTPTNDDKSNEPYGTLDSVGLVSLFLVLILVGTHRLVDCLGPHIGDIITFNPARTTSSDLWQRVNARPGGNPKAASCVLDPRTMVASGGSFVIEAVQPNPNLRYRVNWAGEHTSEGSTDCGAEAVFLLSQPDIATLLLAAGN